MLQGDQGMCGYVYAIECIPRPLYPKIGVVYGSRL